MEPGVGTLFNRLCTREELRDNSVCCGTGGQCDNYLVWTSTFMDGSTNTAYAGDKCCSTNPCQNGGTCTSGVCSCQTGYSGDNCEIGI